MNTMFKLKLTALGHPSPDNFNCEDENEYRSVVLWLEDQKIRHYKIEDREGLRNIDSESWTEAYDAYQKDLVSPCSEGSLNEQLNWLLSYAVRLEYADNVVKYKNAKVEQPKAAPNVVSSNPLDNLDFSSPAFKTGVERVSTIAGIGPHPDPKFRLAALAKILKTAPHPEPTSKDQGFVVQQPSDVLKLMFVQDLRNLQTKINEALVAVQTVTADPRTDTKLGRVGR
ncbi:putative carnitine deficiency-associated protein domain-containing protein [Phthorimaea operculella]|nr:putative carnitine deficiency-associated protein domain-containing protein [Phthorimaea operculella]